MDFVGCVMKKRMKQKRWFTMEKTLFNHLKNQIEEHKKAIQWHEEAIEKIERKMIAKNSCRKCGSEMKEQLYGTEMSTILVCPNCDR